MDRRLFLSGMLGLVGAAAIAGATRPISAMAGVPNTGNGILDELDAPATDLLEEEEPQAEVEQVARRRRRRRRRRRVWRRVCRRFWRNGRWRRRCYRTRVWVWYWI